MANELIPHSVWTPWPLALPTLGTIIGCWRVIGSRPGYILLALPKKR